ncbi:MAG: DNA polymerase III subunit delta' [Rhodobacterales bacterium]|nr:MAG: DNA polymerase III subunit delta' [Rhodobacterales bacterium]
MKTPDDLPEPDRVEGAPHPRETETIIGQQAAEQAFLEAYNLSRLHHAWLITGIRGVGKATLAWKLARFLLAQPEEGPSLLLDAPPKPDSLAVSPDHPVSHRLQALSEPRLFLLRRAWDDKAKRLKPVITVDEVRKLRNFFALSAADGGWRVVIVDTADEMNPNAANALLKLLEEPPDRTVMFLISHQPSRLLPTIRSRCRALRCAPLGADDMATALAAAGATSPANPEALASLSGGSVGEALRLINLGGQESYQELINLFQTLPRLDRARALRLAESVVGKTKEARYDLLLTLMDLFLARVARSGATGMAPFEAAEGEAALLLRLAPSPHAARVWAQLQQELGNRIRHGRAVNLDPAALILDMVFKIDATAAKTAA